MKTILTTLLLLLSTTIFAADHTTVDPYYLYFGAGYAHIDYSKRTLMNETSGQFFLHGDLAIYTPVQPNLLVGATLFTDSEFATYTEENNGGSHSVGLHHIVLGISALYYIDQINSGLFVRGDIGVAKGFLDAPEDNDNDSSEPGFGVRISGGYALPINEDLSTLFSVGYSHKSIEKLDLNTFNVSIGLMF